MADDIDDLARTLRDLNNSSPGNQTYLRRATVTALTGASVTITLGGKSVPGVPVYANVAVNVGDGVDVLLYDGSPRVIGVMGSINADAAIPRLLAYGRCNGASGGVFAGKYAGGGGSGQGSIGISTTEVYPSNNFVNVPVVPGRLLRIKFKYFAASGVDTANEWYFRLKVNPNGTGDVIVGEVRHAPAGAASPSPQGEYLYAVPAGVTVLTNIYQVALKNAGSGTLFRYGDYQDSWMTVEDIGIV